MSLFYINRNKKQNVEIYLIFHIQMLGDLFIAGLK